MKKTLTINLGGIVYHIDDDAYRLLDNYLSNLKHYFRKQEGAEEIVNDIEMRIAELFAEKVTEGKQVITVSDVEEIIARVGKPEDFGIADEDMDSQKRTEQTSSANQGSTQTAAQRRWFRDPDNKLLGGVARVGSLLRLGYHISAYIDDYPGICTLLPDDYTLYYRMDRYSGSPYCRGKIEYAWRSSDH